MVKVKFLCLVLLLLIAACSGGSLQDAGSNSSSSDSSSSATGYDFGHLYDYSVLSQGAAEDLVLVNGRIYVAAKTGGVAVYDIAGSQWVQTIATTGEAWDVTAYHSWLFIADKSGGVPVYDISGVTPQLLDTINPGFSVDSVAVNSNGTRLAVGGASGKLTLYDISNKSSGVPLGGSGQTHILSTGKNISSIAIHGSFVFAGDADGVLIPVDLSDPATPVEGTAYQASAVPGHDAWGLGLTIDRVNNRLYYSDWGAGFIILDVSTPASLVEIGRFMTGDGVYDSAVNGTRAYLANSFGGVAVLDISDPGNIQLVGGSYIKNTVLSGGINKTVSPHGIIYDNNRVYVADNAGQTLAEIIVDETSLAGLPAPSTNETVGPLPDSGSYTYGQVVDYLLTGTAEDLIVSSNYVYVAAKTYGVYVIDISDIDRPVLKKRIDTAGNAWNLSVSGSTLFVADRENGITVIDITDPANAALNGTINAGFNVYDLDVIGAMIYAVGGDGTDGILKIFDYSTPDNVIEAGSYRFTGQYKAGASCAYYSNHLFYGAADGRLYAFDVQDPASIIRKTNSFYNSGIPGHEPWGLGITIDKTNGTLFYSDWGAGLVSVDISDPGAMAQLDSHYTGNGVYDSWLAGDKLYFANSWGGIGILDVSDPAAMVLQNSAYETYSVTKSGFDYPGAPHGVAVSGDYTLIADNSIGGLVILYTGP